MPISAGKKRNLLHRTLPPQLQYAIQKVSIDDGKMNPKFFQL